MKPLRVLIIAGEASGDRHAAELVEALRQRNPGLTFTGIGGDRMKAAGVRLIHHMSRLAFLGITEVIRHLPFIRSVLHEIRAVMREEADAVILVDYPGFNLRVARIAGKLNLPVIYYICPQLWAWGEGRVEKIRRYVDLPLVIFKFEETFFERHGIRARFVGHPLVDQAGAQLEEAKFRQRCSIGPEEKILALFPGSREMEVRNLLPVMGRAAARLREEFGCVIAIGRAPQLPGELYEELLPRQLDVISPPGGSLDLMRYAHAALVASGTATLELGFLQTPMVVLYTVSPLTYFLGRRLVRIPNIALANIVLGERAVPELIQGAVTEDGVAQEARRFFSDEAYYNSVKERLSGIRSALGGGGATDRAADATMDFLRKRFPDGAP